MYRLVPKPLGFAKSRPRQEHLPPMPSPHPNPNTPLPVLTQQPSHAPPGPIILPQVRTLLPIYDLNARNSLLSSPFGIRVPWISW
jgi:hypothetical protein